MALTAKELAGLIELSRKKGELEFKARISGSAYSDELKAVSAESLRLDQKAAAAGIKITFPNQAKIEELSDIAAGCSKDEIRNALQNRTGPTYELLMERARVMKANGENKLEIAKLHLAMTSLGKEERDAVAAALRTGALDAPLKVDTAEAATRKKLALFMRRCGIACRLSGTSLIADSDAADEEVRVALANGIVWLSEEAKEKLAQNLDRMGAISGRVQLKNAERQVRTFSENEEKEFEELQHQYLELLKEQDELLREFNEEENNLGRNR